MAKKIEELVVGLNIEGLEKVDRLRSAFRELSKVTKLNDTELRDMRQRLIDYGNQADNSERVTKGLEQAFRGLIGEARRGSAIWEQLNRDVAAFAQQARLTDDEIAKLAAGVTEEARAHKQSEASIRAHIKSLQDLRAQSVLGGQVNRQLGDTIEQLTTQLDQATASSRTHFSALTRALAVRPDAVLNQWRDYTKILRDARATTEQVAAAQERLNKLAGAPRIAARREVAARAEIIGDPDYVSRFGVSGRSLEALPDVPAALSLRLRELQEDLNYTSRSTNVYVDILVEMARVQREASSTTQGLAARLREQLQAGQIAPSQRNLQEVIGALRREMLELDQTTEEGARQYAENARQADVLERQLKELANSYRTVAEAAGQAATAEQNAANARIRGNYFNRRMMREQEQAFASFAAGVRQAAASTPLMLPAAGMTSAAGTGQAISGGARRLTGQVETTFGEPSYRNPRAIAFMGREGLPSAAIGQPAAVGLTPDAYEAQAKAAREAAGNLDQYRVAVDKAAKANNGSINGLNGYQQALVALRNQIPATNGEFKKLERQIQQVDARMERLQRTRRRMGAMEATQAAGAVISGGIFGGPEGALGGVIGTIAGGVPGAFAGAAAGAQVGIIRQQLGAMAEFTAEIDKQRIALRNVVGSQEQYQQALQFIDATSRRAAIPQDQLTRQFTQLAASVIGAGGNVDVAERAFRGMAAGIRGTGGSLEAMQAAMLATSQVFSKGKVSAEEIRQQIGERLPGAFTTFATAVGKTPAMLDKMLQKGEVTLNDFMLLIEELIKTYEPSMDKIAASSQAAGDRMQVTFARLREAIGRELQPVGAQFQELFAKVLEENEQKIIEFAKGIAEAARAIADFLTTSGPAIVEIAKLAVQFAAANLAIKAFVALRGPVSTMFLALQSGFTATTAQAAAAQTRMIAFGATVKAIAASLAAPIIVTVAIVGAGIVLKTLNDIKNARDRLTREAILPQGEQFIQSIGGKAASYETLVRNANEVAKALDIEEQNLKKLRERAAQRQVTTVSGLNQEDGLLKTQIDTTQKSINRLRLNYKALIDAIPGAKRAAQAGADFEFPGGDLNAAGKEKKPAQLPQSREIQLRAELEAIIAIGKAEDEIRDLRFRGLEDQAIYAERAKTLADIERDRIKALQGANYPQERILINKIAEARITDAILKSEDQLRQYRQQTFEEGLGYEKAIRDTIQPFSDLIRDQELQVQYSKTVSRLLNEGILPAEAERIASFERNVELQARILEAEIAVTQEKIKQAELLKLSTVDLEKQLALSEARLNAIRGVAAAGPGAGVTAGDRARDAANVLRGELNSLVDPINQITNAATTIGDAFGNSFKGIISGSMSAKEALQSFFKDIASSFLDMAAKIIAKQITMFILNTLLGFAGGGGSSWGGSGFNPVAFTPGLQLNANGNAFTQNGIVPYAKGGVVNRPTLFKFANGGAMQTGLMGEAGPEAIMPLRRGPNGKLGVQATGLREAMGSASGGGYTAPVLNMSFQSTTINGVEYVSRDQLEAAMEETRRRATREGANRGMSMTLDKLQQSPQTRSRLGIR